MHSFQTNFKTIVEELELDFRTLNKEILKLSQCAIGIDTELKRASGNIAGSVKEFVKELSDCANKLSKEFDCSQKVLKDMNATLGKAVQSLADVPAHSAEVSPAFRSLTTDLKNGRLVLKEYQCFLEILQQNNLN